MARDILGRGFKIEEVRGRFGGEDTVVTVYDNSTNKVVFRERVHTSGFWNLALDGSDPITQGDFMRRALDRANEAVRTGRNPRKKSRRKR